MDTFAAVQSAHRAALACIFAGEKPDHLLCLAGDYAGYYGPCEDAPFARWLDEELPGIIERIHAAGEDPVNFRPPVVEFSPLGVHFVDALFGARVYRYEEQWWSETLPCRLAGLDFVDVPEAPLVVWVTEAMTKILARLPADFSVAAPVFSSTLNVAINLCGESALEDVPDASAETIRGLAAITATVCRLHAWVRNQFLERARFYCSSVRYAPDGVGHLCGCSTQLLSAELYRHYFAPFDEHVLGIYPGGGTVHLCGHHTQHLPIWRAMSLLRGVQLNDAAADDFSAYFAGLRDDQVIYIYPTEAMPLEEILRISCGRRVILQGWLEAPVPLATNRSTR